MKIGFYSSRPLEDKKNWSGTMYKMYEQMLLHGHEIVWIPKVEYTSKEEKRFEQIERTFNKVFKRNYNKHLFYYKAKIASKRLKKTIKGLDIDLLFVPTYVNDIVFLNIKQPIVYLNDANVVQLFNYYTYYMGLGFLTKLESKYLEKKMLQNVDVAVFSSDWASNYAIEEYGIEKDKVRTIKFGANLEVPESIQSNKRSDVFTFLFLAVEWKRKRGQLAYESLKILKEKGYPIEMLIVGCNPDIKEDWVTIIPFLNKNVPQEFAEIQRHLLESHLLFVPTEADCTPIAFCEAAAYGLPTISTNTGGVAAHIEHLKTGVLLPSKAKAEEYAKAIEETYLLSTENIQIHGKNARLKYEKELNWKAFGQALNEVITKFEKE